MANQYYLTNRDRNRINGMYDDVANLTGGRTMRRRERTRGTTGGGEYEGPFAVSQDGDDVIVMAAGNVILGQSSVVFLQSPTTVTTEAGIHYICIAVYWEKQAYSAAWEDLIVPPDQSDVTVNGINFPAFRKEIARVTMADGIISEIKQTQYGEIVVGSRLV